MRTHGAGRREGFRPGLRTVGVVEQLRVVDRRQGELPLHRAAAVREVESGWRQAPRPVAFVDADRARPVAQVPGCVIAFGQGREAAVGAESSVGGLRANTPEQFGQSSSDAPLSVLHLGRGDRRGQRSTGSVRVIGGHLLGPRSELNCSVTAVRHDVVPVLIQALAAVTLGHPRSGNVRRVESPARVPARARNCSIDRSSSGVARPCGPTSSLSPIGPHSVSRRCSCGSEATRNCQTLKIRRALPDRNSSVASSSRPSSPRCSSAWPGVIMG